ncbi:HalOD1 output domain-containing protein [Natrinema longum]|uniref:Halobacterial output domain-containing protein n=1 Tax=Natrinema longum TaxID=370324 RepID=A0A8A2U9W3_9EURY|nr:HalOD1 output domain-containing protein [Natrinema longum]MBZ6493431.1 hypothetical protein [Natrinema longum]QSW85222.1 hypothetical protein J0X27_17540 [Natrinema longum]
MSNSTPTSLRVVQGVAAHEGVDPMNLEPPLHEVIDTDALDALYRKADASSVRIEFTYRENHVRIDESGHVDVTDATTDCGSSTAVE